MQFDICHHIFASYGIACLEENPSGVSPAAQGNMDKRVWVKMNTSELSKDMCGMRWYMKCCDFLLTEHAEFSRKAQ